MKICPICRKEYTNETTCPKCGVPLINKESKQSKTQKDSYYKVGETQEDEYYNTIETQKDSYYNTVETQKDNNYYKQDEKKEKTGQYNNYHQIEKNKNTVNEDTVSISKTTLLGGIIAVLCVVLVVFSLKYLGMNNNDSPAGDTGVTQAENTTEYEDDTTESTEEMDNQEFPDNVVYNPDNGHHYAVYDYTDYNLYEDFDAWEQFCEDRGGYLAVIENQEENDFIYQYLRDSGLTLAFFGYTDQNSEGKWTWVNGRHSNYENWAYGQPNNGSTTKGKKAENYAQFFKDTADGTWNDSQIAVNTYKFICEWDY